MINKHHSMVCILLMRHFPMQLISISEIMCQTHAFTVRLLSIYLGEKFTRSPMSQGLRASAGPLMCELFALFCLLKSWNHHEWWLHSAPANARAKHSLRNSVYERKVYKYSTGKFIFKMCLHKLAQLADEAVSSIVWHREKGGFGTRK